MSGSSQDFKKRREKRRRDMVAVLSRGYETADFDKQFWASVSGEERTDAGWSLVVEAHLHKGGKESELRLQRSVAVLKYGPG